MKKDVVTIKTGYDEEKKKGIGKVIIDAPNIELGKETSATIAEYLIKGETFINLFNTHTHAGSGTPPTSQMVADVVLSKTTKTK